MDTRSPDRVGQICACLDQITDRIGHLVDHLGHLIDHLGHLIDRHDRAPIASASPQIVSISFPMPYILPGIR